MQHARLLVLPVEFNPHANDGFSGFARYDANDPSGCVSEPAGMVFNGPTHNQIPNPASRRTTPRSGRSAGTRSRCASKTNPDPAKYYEVACNRFGSRGAVRRSTDAIGWYPGLESRPDLDPDDPLFFRDADASVVIPSKGNQIYSTRITDKSGRLLRSQFGSDLGDGHVAGTSNPRDGTLTNPTDLSLGVKFRVKRASGKSRRSSCGPATGSARREARQLAA